MKQINIPSRVPAPFAVSGTKNTIPLASQIGITPGAASWTDGFPPLTRTPLTAGGVPPSGADMNGVLNAVSAGANWAAAGGLYVHDATFATQIGGYPKGAVLISDDGTQLWLSTVDDNMTDPDAGGAGWRSLTAGRLIGVRQFTSNTTYTPTAGTTSIIVEAVGGGGAGGGSAATSGTTMAVGSGGASGSLSRARFTTGFSGAAIVIGAGGTGTAGAAGGAGGSTTFGGTLVVAPGGGGGGVATATSPSHGISAQGVPGAVPTTSGATVLAACTGQPGGCGMIFGGFGPISGHGGSSPLGGGGGTNSVNGAGGAGSARGAGGGGGASAVSQSASVGGAGGAGQIVIYEYA